MVTANERKDLLRALSDYELRGNIDDLQGLAKALSGESDRGMVVIAGSLTEDLLLEEIWKRLPPIDAKQRKLLAKTGGVLGSWVRRVNFARALGIINERDVAELEVLSTMRNSCAHSRSSIDFTTRELVSVMALYFDPGGDGLHDIPRQDLRTIFTYLVSTIWASIKGQDRKSSAEMISSLLSHMEQQKAWPKKRSKQPSQADSKAPTKRAR